MPIKAKRSPDKDADQRVKKVSANSFEGVPDLDIWRQFKAGNESAFIHIYELYFEPLFNYGLQFTRDMALVEDCIQDLFIEIRKTRGRLSDTTSIKLYLYKAIKRKIIQLIKYKRSRFHHEPIDEGYQFHFVFSHEHYLINQQLDQEQLHKLNEALKKLPLRQKEVIYYYFYEQLSYAEIKEIMEFVSIKSVRNKAYIALQTLRKSYS